MPELKPPHGELPPSFWEQYGWVVLIAGIVGVVLLAGLILLLSRPKPMAPTLPEALARQTLDLLRGRGENGEVLVNVSRILRGYLVFALGLPPTELTTTEICAALEATPMIPPEMASGIGKFLQQCDERKFSPAPPAPPRSAVDTALEWLEKVEAERRKMQAAAAISITTTVNAA
jgi:hypothetical protein